MERGEQMNNGYSKIEGHLYIDVMDKIYEHFKTSRTLMAEELTAIIGEVIAEHNTFEKIENGIELDTVDIP